MKKDNMNPSQWKFPKYMKTVNSVPHRGETWHTVNHMDKSGICRHDEKQRLTIHTDFKHQALRPSDCPYLSSWWGTQKEGKRCWHHVSINHFPLWNPFLALEMLKYVLLNKTISYVLKLKTISPWVSQATFSNVVTVQHTIVFVCGLFVFLYLIHWEYTR